MAKIAVQIGFIVTVFLAPLILGIVTLRQVIRQKHQIHLGNRGDRGGSCQLDTSHSVVFCRTQIFWKSPPDDRDRRPLCSLFLVACGRISCLVRRQMEAVRCQPHSAFALDCSRTASIHERQRFYAERILSAEQPTKSVVPVADMQLPYFIKWRTTTEEDTMTQR